MNELHYITETSEDARSSQHTQYGVKLTYRDSGTSIHIRENRLSAENMVKIHKQMMDQEPEWRVVDVELIERTVTLTLGEWREVR